MYTAERTLTSFAGLPAISSKALLSGMLSGVLVMAGCGGGGETGGGTADSAGATVASADEATLAADSKRARRVQSFNGGRSTSSTSNGSTTSTGTTTTTTTTTSGSGTTTAPSGSTSSSTSSSSTSSTASSTPTSTTSTTSTPSSAINTLDTIVNDMKLKNDFVLKGYESYTTGWYTGPGSVQMGANPCFCNVPTWSEFYNNPKYAGVTPQAMLPWVVVLAGVGNSATNTAFQIRNVMFYIKSKSTGTWKLFSGPAGATGMSFGTAAAPGTMQDQINVTLADGSTAIKPPVDTMMWHGWNDAGIIGINPSDMSAVFVTMQARLVVADASKADDRAKAQYGIQVGADYYLNTTTTWGNGIAPGSGVTRTKKLSNDWQSMSYTTFNDVGSQDPGAGISEAVFRAAPPPLQ